MRFHWQRRVGMPQRWILRLTCRPAALPPKPQKMIINNAIRKICNTAIVFLHSSTCVFTEAFTKSDQIGTYFDQVAKLSDSVLCWLSSLCRFCRHSCRRYYCDRREHYQFFVVLRNFTAVFERAPKAHVKARITIVRNH